MTGVLVSQHVADLYSARISDIGKRCAHTLQVIAFAPAAAAVRQDIQIAFYSRDMWEGCDKTSINAVTSGFFAAVDAIPDLRWLHVTSAGIDLPMYRPSLARAVRVTSSSGANAEPVGLTAVTGLLMLARGFPHWMRAQQKREWSPQLGAASPADLPGQTAVIVGMGHIGKVIARVLHAIGVRVIGLRRTIAPAEHFDEVLPLSALDGVLPKSDWLVIACPLTAETRGLIDERRFKLLPRTAGFINISRGEVADEAALARVLAGGHLRGAYLDVFKAEPLAPESPLWTMQNVIITPHNSATGTGNHRRGVEIFLRNLEAYLRGDALLENETARVLPVNAGAV